MAGEHSRVAERMGLLPVFGLRENEEVGVCMCSSHQTVLCTRQQRAQSVSMPLGQSVEEYLVQGLCSKHLGTEIQRCYVVSRVGNVLPRRVG